MRILGDRRRLLRCALRRNIEVLRHYVLPPVADVIENEIYSADTASKTAP